jgi:hypothetical protein
LSDKQTFVDRLINSIAVGIRAQSLEPPPAADRPWGVRRTLLASDSIAQRRTKRRSRAGPTAEAYSLSRREGALAKVTIPKNAGTFRASRAPITGTWIVMNDRTGKNQVLFACQTRGQAEEFCRRLNAGEHSGEINVPNRTKR